MNRLVPGAVACVLALLGAPGPAAAEPQPDELARQVREVFRTHCYRCHGKDGANEGGLNYVLDRRRLLERRKVFPGDPAKSKLFRRLASTDEPMPPAEEKPRPSAA